MSYRTIECRVGKEPVTAVIPPGEEDPYFSIYDMVTLFGSTRGSVSSALAGADAVNPRKPLMLPFVASDGQTRHVAHYHVEHAVQVGIRMHSSYAKRFMWWAARAIQGVEAEPTPRPAPAKTIAEHVAAIAAIQQKQITELEQRIEQLEAGSI